MNRARVFIVAGALCSYCAVAQSQTSGQAAAQTSGQASVQAGQTQTQAGASSSTAAAAQAQNGQTSLASGAAFNAELNSSIDSKKCKPGDAVNAHTTEAVKSEGKTVIPKGSKLMGHVTQASARANGQADSSLGIVFDKAILKNGQEVPLNVAIQALASAEGAASAAGPDLDAMGSVGGSAAGSASSGGRGTLGGVASTAGAAAGTVTNTAGRAAGAAGGAVNSTASAAGGVTSASKGAVGGLNASGQLSSNSQGVFGLNGLNLNAAASNATQGSVITSAGKNVHLDSGTKMLLVTQAQAGEQPAAKQPTPKPKPESKQEPKKTEKP